MSKIENKMSKSHSLWVSLLLIIFVNHLHFEKIIHHSKNKPNKYISKFDNIQGFGSYWRLPLVEPVDGDGCIPVE